MDRRKNILKLKHKKQKKMVQRDCFTAVMMHQPDFKPVKRFIVGLYDCTRNNEF